MSLEFRFHNSQLNYEFIILYLNSLYGGRSSMVEHRFVEPMVAGSNPVDHPRRDLGC